MKVPFCNRDSRFVSENPEFTFILHLDIISSAVNFCIASRSRISLSMYSKFLWLLTNNSMQQKNQQTYCETRCARFALSTGFSHYSYIAGGNKAEHPVNGFGDLVITAYKPLFHWVFNHPI